MTAISMRTIRRRAQTGDKRASFWVYGLALLPSVLFFGHGVEARFRIDRREGRGRGAVG